MESLILLGELEGKDKKQDLSAGHQSGTVTFVRAWVGPPAQNQDTPLPNDVQTPHIPPVNFHVEQLSLSRVVAPESEGYIARSEFGALWFHFPSPGFLK